MVKNSERDPQSSIFDLLRTWRLGARICPSVPVIFKGDAKSTNKGYLPTRDWNLFFVAFVIPWVNRACLAAAGGLLFCQIPLHDLRKENAS